MNAKKALRLFTVSYTVFSIILRPFWTHRQCPAVFFCVRLSTVFNTQHSVWFGHSCQKGLLQDKCDSFHRNGSGECGLSTWLSWCTIKERDSTFLNEMDAWMIPRAYSLHSSEENAQRLDKLPIWWKVYRTQSPYVKKRILRSVALHRALLKTSIPTSLRKQAVDSSFLSVKTCSTQKVLSLWNSYVHYGHVLEHGAARIKQGMGWRHPLPWNQRF